MGGMNAGEVASALGVETIKSFFAPQLLTDEVLANDERVCAYMKYAIIKADSVIKEEANKDDAKHGMGSTAVMAWLLGKKVYVAWCGDSRCYRYNQVTGLEQLSHDHSYVQDLVDTGHLLPELAFDHPSKNIITRSLGDPRGAARPDVKTYDLAPGDVILLCSDGLSDSLKDNEIEQSISRSLASMAACRDALWHDSQQAGWYDNVTIVLAQVVEEKASSYVRSNQPASRPQIPTSSLSQVTTPATSGSTQNLLNGLTQQLTGALVKQRKLLFLVVLLVFILCFFMYYHCESDGGVKPDTEKMEEDIKKDNICIELYNELMLLNVGSIKEDTVDRLLRSQFEKYELYKGIESNKQKKDEVKEHLYQVFGDEAGLLEASNSSLAKKNAKIIRELQKKIK